MSEDMTEPMEALASLMDQECDLLAHPASHREVETLARAKLRLTTILEMQVATAAREDSAWLEAGAQDEAFAAAVARLRHSAERNARTLARHIDLSRDLLDAVAAEARRLAGTRQETYGPAGALTKVDGPVPVSINTRL